MFMLNSNRLFLNLSVLNLPKLDLQRKVTAANRGNSLSQGALQRVVVVFETFELQEVFGPLAALAGRGQVGDLDGGGGVPDRRASQVLGCRLVMLVQAGGAGIRLHPGERQQKRNDYYLKKVPIVKQMDSHD